MNFALERPRARSPHLQGEQFKLSAQVDIVHIPFKGSAPAMLAMLRNDVQIMFDVVATTKSYIQSGKMRILAVTTKKRMPELPDVPTFAELGYPELGMNAFYGIVAPAKESPEFVKRVNAAARKVIDSPEFAQGLMKQDLVALSSTPEELTARIKLEIETWGGVVKASGFKIE